MLGICPQSFLDKRPWSKVNKLVRYYDSSVTETGVFLDIRFKK
jgi:hypothetical protein